MPSVNSTSARSATSGPQRSAPGPLKCRALQSTREPSVSSGIGRRGQQDALERNVMVERLSLYKFGGGGTGRDVAMVGTFSGDMPRNKIRRREKRVLIGEREERCVARY